MTDINLDELSIGEVATLLVDSLSKREESLQRELAKVQEMRESVSSFIDVTASPLGLSTVAEVPAAPRATPIRQKRTNKVDSPVKGPRGAKTPKGKDMTKAPAHSGKRSYTNWGAIHEALLGGDIDQYVTVIKTSSVDSTKSTLLKRFPDLFVRANPQEDGTARLRVRLIGNSEVAA
jgi:hypothetical protein